MMAVRDLGVGRRESEAPAEPLAEPLCGSARASPSMIGKTISKVSMFCYERAKVLSHAQP